MNKIFTVIRVALAFAFSAKAATLSSLTWANVCSGGMGDDWYGTDEAMEVADIVLSVQKNNGGWMKNDQLHKLTASELNALQRSKGEHSCFDNYATTQEMRFLSGPSISSSRRARDSTEDGDNTGLFLQTNIVIRII